jgi:hypothetical protein
VAPATSPGTQNQASKYIPIPPIPFLIANLTLLQFRCHCTDENHLAGNGFSNNYYVADLEETLKVLKPGFKHWTQVVLSGNNMTNHFCGECGSLVYRTSSGFPGFALKVGNIDVSGLSSGHVSMAMAGRSWATRLTHSSNLPGHSYYLLISGCCATISKIIC